MSTSEEIFDRQRKGSMEDEPNLDDTLESIKVRQYPYQRARHLSWGSYGPIGHLRVLGQRQILSGTDYHPSSARSAELYGEHPSPLLPIETVNTSTVSRASYSDSEFSQHQIPVSPERYEVALNAIERISPSTPKISCVNTSEDLKVHGSRIEANAGRFLGSDEYGDPNIPTTTLVLDPSSNYPSDLAWSPSLSDDETQNADLSSDSYQNNDTFAKPARSADCPRHAANAVELPYTARSASSSGSMSTNFWDLSSQPPENLEHVMKFVQLPPGPSASSPGSNSINPDAPFINVKISECNIDTRSNRKLQSAPGPRYSDSLGEDTSLRQQSEGEIKAELQTAMPSLEEITRRGQRTCSLSHESSFLVQAQGYGRPMPEQQLLPLRPLGQRLTELDPGSSQTSSSMSADRPTAAMSSRAGKVALYKECSSSSEFRSPTPPLLFGRRTMSSHRTQVSEALAPSHPLGSAAEDWETVSDMKSNMRGVNNDAVDTPMGSSLADNSDPGDGPVIEPNTGSHRKLGASQHLGLPRHHQAFVIMKDNRSGSTTNIPLRDFDEGRLYQHPMPMAGRHLNPFISSPPAIRSREDSTDLIGHSATLVHQALQKRMSAKSNSTSGFDKLIDSFGSINDSRNRQDVAIVHEGVVDLHKQEPASKEPSRESSAWLSTVSESASGGDSSLPLRSGSFAKVTVLNSKGNLTGTPQGTGAREVGSSLAGASSPRDQLSSSPVPRLDSVRLPSVGARSPQTPRQRTEAHWLTMPEVPSSVASTIHTPPHSRTSAPLSTFKASSSPTSGVQTPSYQNVPCHIVSTPDVSSIYSSKAQSLSECSSAAFDIESRLASGAQALIVEGLSNQRRRRSSSESKCRVIASSAPTKASAIPSPDPHGHKKRNTMVGLLSNYSLFDEEDSEDSQHQKPMRERQGHRGAFPHDASSHTLLNVIPIFHHAVTNRCHNGCSC